MNYINNITKINYIKINQYVIYHLIIITKVKICFGGGGGGGAI